MTQRFLLAGALICGLAATLGPQAYGQTSFRSELIVRNNGAGVDTLRWGVEPGATDKIDTELGEYELPPLPPGPEVFWVRFFDPPMHTGFGTGVNRDFREYRSASQIDTFAIRFQAGAGGYPVTITWPEEVRAKAKRLVLKSLIDSVDLLTAASYTITIDAIDRLTLIREGDAASGVELEKGAQGYSLERVAPNPVSASVGGEITYTTPIPSHVSLKLYDAIGALVTTLVDGSQTGDHHSVRIPVEELAPGMYFYTLTSGEYIATRSFVIVD